MALVIENHGNLCAAGMASGVEMVAAHTADDAVRPGPIYGSQSISADSVFICKISGRYPRAPLIAPENSDQLLPRDGVSRAKTPVAVAADNVVILCLCHGVRVILTGGYVRKAAGFHLGTALHPVKDGR